MAAYPLQRPRRAELPHPAPDLVGKRQALGEPGMADEGGLEAAVEVAGHALFVKARLLSPSLHHPALQPTAHLAEEADARAVVGHAKGAHVPRNDAAQVGPLLRDGQMLAPPQRSLQGQELGLQLLAHRPAKQGERSLPPHLAARRQKAEQVEGAGRRAAPVASVVCALRPNAMRCVLSGCSVRPYFKNRLQSAGRKRSASSRRVRLPSSNLETPTAYNRLRVTWGCRGLLTLPLMMLPFPTTRRCNRRTEAR